MRLERPKRSANHAAAVAARPVGAIRILLADDHTLVRAGVRTLLEYVPDFVVVGEASTATETVTLARKLTPDLLLLDVAMPGGSGLDVLTELGQVADLRIILLTAGLETPDIVLGLERGVHGIVLKDAATAELHDTIRAVMRGEYRVGPDVVTALVRRIAPSRAQASWAPLPFNLTPREGEIVAAIRDGLTNRDIAAKLGIIEDTVKHHLTSVFNKTGVSNRLELALLALDSGLGEREDR